MVVPSKRPASSRAVAFHRDTHATGEALLID